MGRLLSYARPSRSPPFRWKFMTFVNCLFSLAVMFGLSTLWSHNLDSSWDQVNNSSPRQLSSYQVPGVEGANQAKVLLVPVKFDTRGHPTIIIDFHHFQRTDSVTSGQQRGIVKPTTNGVPTYSSVLDTKGKESHPLHSRSISYKDEDMVPMVRNSSVVWELSSIPWRLDSGTTLGRDRTRSVTFFVGASLLFVLGAVILKKGLEKAQRWDRQMQVDSLAYDLAYTDTRSYPGYGSFVSPASLDEFDRFDV